MIIHEHRFEVRAGSDTIYNPRFRYKLTRMRHDNLAAFRYRFQ